MCTPIRVSGRSAKSSALLGTRCPMTSQICPYSLTLDPQKPKRLPGPPPSKPSVTKSITIIKDCCGATQCCIM